jgi:C-terminal processing protease CtpA/Prc
MLGELKVSHMDIMPAAALAQSSSPPATTGLRLSNVEGRVTVVRVLPGSAAERAGVRPGFVLARVDGEEVKALEEAAELLDDEPGTKARVTLLDADERPREFELERAPPRPGEVEHTTEGKYTSYARFDTRRLEGGVGYIRFSGFIPALNRKLETAATAAATTPSPSNSRACSSTGRRSSWSRAGAGAKTSTTRRGPRSARTSARSSSSWTARAVRRASS